MFDGSELPYEENVRQTQRVVELAHLVGVSVEGEVGTIGIMNYSDEGGVDHITYTRPEEVADFTARTGVDSLAVAIGTSHGLYPEGFVPPCRLKLLKELKQVSPVPLVLHGGSTIRTRRSVRRVRSESAKLTLPAITRRLIPAS